MPKQIELTQGQVAIVCDCHAHLVEGYKWYARWDAHTQNFYALRNALVSESPRERHTFFIMHAVVNDTPKGLNTDHINGNTLDNRCSNLRTATPSQNGMNRRKNTNNKSGHKGVTWHKGMSKWQANIRVNWKQKYLGAFDNYSDAVAAREAAEKKYFGEFARNKSGMRSL